VQLFQDTDYSNVATDFPIGKKVGLGLSWSRIAVRNIEITGFTPSDNSLGTVNTAQDSMILGAALSSGKIKYRPVREVFEPEPRPGYSDSGYSSDLGIILGSVKHRLAFVMKDAYGFSGGDKIPASYLVGWTWSGFWEKKSAGEEEIYRPHSDDGPDGKP